MRTSANSVRSKPRSVSRYVQIAFIERSVGNFTMAYDLYCSSSNQLDNNASGTQSSHDHNYTSSTQSTYDVFKFDSCRFNTIDWSDLIMTKIAIALLVLDHDQNLWPGVHIPQSIVYTFMYYFGWYWFVL